MNLQNIDLKAAASAGSNVLNAGNAGRTGTQGSGADFKALFAKQLSALQADYEETGLTAAEQALREAGGKAALEAKKYLQKRGSALFTDKIKAGDGPGAANHVTEAETIKRFMPDGTIMTLTFENGKLVKENRRKAEMVTKPDFSRPARLVNGEEKPQLKLVPRLNVFDDLI